MPSENTDQRKLAAIMFTDMVGYSALSQRNEALALELLAENQRLLRTQFPLFNGREVKTTGDGFLVEFPSALQATQCAVEIQRALAARNGAQPIERHVQVRIGIHVGDVVHREADMYGDGVNIAARIEPLAIGGGICLSDTVYAQVRNKLDVGLTKLNSPELKHIEVPMDVYRVVLPWQQHAPVAGKSAKPSAAKSSSRTLAVGTVVVLMLFAVGFGWWLVHQSRQATKQVASSSGATNAASTADQKSIAVLPFVNMSADKDNEYLSDGITEEILNALAKVPGLRVPARTSSFVFKDKKEDVRKIGELLNVRTVLEGSVRKAGNQLRITAQLINVADGFHLWSETYDRNMTNIFAIQDDIARTIVTQLKLTLAGPAGLPSAKHHTVNVEAYELYLKGKFHADKLTEPELNQAITHFQAALGKQPDYALAYAGLAYAHGSLNLWAYVSPGSVTPQLRAAVAKALELDDTLAEAHVHLARLSFFVDWDWDMAEREFKRALELDPANAYAHVMYAYLLSARGRHPEARAEANKAHQLDPLSVLAKVALGRTSSWAGDNDRALEAGRQAIAMEPNSFIAHHLTGDVLMRKGRREEGIAEMEKAAQIAPVPQVLGLLGRMYGRVGRKADAQKVLDQFLARAKQQYVPARSIADVYDGLGDFEQANVWMNKAIADRESSLVHFKVMADDITRANPHYPEWLKKIGLDK